MHRQCAAYFIHYNRSFGTKYAERLNRGNFRRKETLAFWDGRVNLFHANSQKIAFRETAEVYRSFDYSCIKRIYAKEGNARYQGIGQYLLIFITSRVSLFTYKRFRRYKVNFLSSWHLSVSALRIGFSWNEKNKGRLTLDLRRDYGEIVFYYRETVETLIKMQDVLKNYTTIYNFNLNIKLLLSFIKSNIF